MGGRFRWAVLLVVCVVLGGCSVGGDGASSTASERPVASVASSASGVDTAAALERWRAWQPRVPVVPKEYTDEEAEEIRLAYMESNRPDAAAGRPIPDLVAWNDYSIEMIAQCIRDAGFPLVEAAEDGVSIKNNNLPSAQEDLYHIAFWECNAKYPLPPQWMDENQDDERTSRIYYEYYTTFYLDCLAGLGIELPRDNIPSEQTWVTQFQSGSTEWDPTMTSTWPQEALLAWSRTRIRDLNTVCPESPPLRASFG